MSESVLTRDVRQRTKAFVVVAALALLAVAALWLEGRGAVTPRVIEGWAMPNATGAAISLHDTPGNGWGEGYIVAGARWSGPDNVWHDGTELPTCIGTDTSSFTHVRLGVITVEAEQASWEHVVWLRCLE